ncbi:hypothetical protein AARAC_008474 [Aspergillus arachidicola]|uniref:Uncharacterized protein n=1 Tax=Aspergillus arachidicola TaxID=656916 RepID=A0A2G7FZV7_9EURO|nr:hypothetical protein AARAC_008474 [Aspergillus arachidicola]
MEEGTTNTNPLEPPPLPYSLRTRKKSIAIFWILFVIDALAQPVALYFGLWYGTNLSHNLVFTIVTASLGGISVFEYFYRLYNLFRKDSRTRPLNARKSWLDFFHINFTIVWLILAVELIVGTVQEEPYVRLVAMVLPSVMFYFGGVYLALDILRVLGFKAPFRISSTPKGSTMPTALYVMIEEWWQWMAAGARLTGMPFESGIFPAHTSALGWSLPFVWAGVWTLITIPWVQSDLRREKKAWAENRGQGGIPYTDDISAPADRTRLESIHEHMPNLWPWGREKNKEKPSTQSTPSDGHSNV